MQAIPAARLLAAFRGAIEPLVHAPQRVADHDVNAIVVALVTGDAWWATRTAGDSPLVSCNAERAGRAPVEGAGRALSR